MNYLTKFLSDEALMTAKVLKLSNSNYQVAIDLLTEKFGDPQLLISAHRGNLLNLPNVCSINDLQELRFLYDRVETEVWKFKLFRTTNNKLRSYISTCVNGKNSF